MPKADAKFERFTRRWKLAVDAEHDLRTNMLADQEFEQGQHWDSKIEGDRKKAGKPALTIDLTSGPIKMVTNQQRLARPGIKVSAVGHGTDPEKAELWQSIVRRVERLSDAARVYAWAGQHQVVMGRGFWVVRNRRARGSFEQDIWIEELDNQHMAYIDPTCKKLNGSDKKWAALFEDLTHEDYIERFGESDLSGMLSAKSWSSIGDTPPDWITSSHCRIAEYYELVTTSRAKHLLSDGSEVWDDELEHVAEKRGRKTVQAPVPPDGLTIEQTADMDEVTVEWCLYNGAGEVLESATIPCDYIPVVKVYGERRNVNGKVDERGMVRMAKDPSRMEDWAESSLMEAMSIAKTAPWIVPIEAIADYQKQWETSNTINYAALFYRQYDEQGRPLEKPTRPPNNMDVSAFTLAAQRMQNHVRNVMGNADVFQEETRSEQSGRAIRERKLNQELGTSDYMENLGAGIVLTAKIVMSMARKLYDTPRLMRITGADEKDRPIVTYKGEGQRPAAEAKAQELLQGEAKGQDVASLLFDIDGNPEDFDVAISAGKRHDTARQESVEVLSEVIKIPGLPPELLRPAIVALIKNVDGPGMAELAESVDPAKQDEIPPAVQQHIEQLQQQLQQAIQIIETDQVKQQAALQKSEMDNEARKAIEVLKAQSALVLERLTERFDLIEMKMQHQHELRMAGVQERQAEAAAERGHRIAQEESDQGHQQALEQGDIVHAHSLEQQQAAGAVDGQ